MKKGLILLLSVFFLLPLAVGCSSTAYTERDEYEAGELIWIYDRESDSKLAKLRITNVEILEETVYDEEEYDAILVISYEGQVLDSRYSLDENNFEIDAEEGVFLPGHDEADSDRLVLGLYEKEDFALSFVFHDLFDYLFEIEFEYDEDQEEYVLCEDGSSQEEACSCGTKVDLFDNYCWNCGEKLD